MSGLTHLSCSTLTARQECWDWERIGAVGHSALILDSFQQGLKGLGNGRSTDRQHQPRNN
jgi:hypothetical protein